LKNGHVLALLGVCSMSAPIFAAIIPIDSADRGFYSQAGVHDPANNSYFAGFNAQEFRNWFVFDLSTAPSGSWVGATLVLDGRFFSTNSTSETYIVTSLDRPLNPLRNGNGGVSAFAAMGTGTAYGSLTRSLPNTGPATVSIPLSAAFLADLASNPNGTFGFGGRITTLDPIGAMFGSSSSAEGGFTPRLLLDDGAATVPLPSAAGLAGLGMLLGLAAVVRPRR